MLQKGQSRYKYQILKRKTGPPKNSSSLKQTCGLTIHFGHVATHRDILTKGNYNALDVGYRQLSCNTHMVFAWPSVPVVSN
jgi:hypothetical protein